jgi:hypothetical protein
MHLVQLLLPVADNAGHAFSRHMYADLAHSLTARFGGVTAYTRNAAEGYWGSKTQRRDDMYVMEVMTEGLDHAWWSSFRETLEQQFKQDKIVIRASIVELI